MRLLLHNASIIDGTGAAAYSGDLLVEDGIIAEVGATTLTPDETIDLEGLAVAPGFIDVHSHNDFSLPVEPTSLAKISQGVTTEIVGNCGLGLTPANDRVDRMYAHAAPLIFGERAESCSPDLNHYRQRLESTGIALNAAMLVPHGNIRCAVMGMAERDATPAELREMTALVENEMSAGAVGLSSGLVYPPGAFAPTDELITLARAVAPFEGLYATHMRDEGNKVVEAVAEAITIGRQAGVGVQISHHKAAGQLNWGKVNTTLGLVDQARSDGLDVHSDVYPYAAGASVLAAMALPSWVFDGSHREVMERLRDSETRRRIITEAKERMLKFVDLPGALGFVPKKLLLPIILKKLSGSVVISSVKNNHDWEGMSLAQIVKRKRRPLFEAVLDLLVEEDGAVLAIAHVMSEDDMKMVMGHPHTMIGSDGLPIQGGKPHPRTWGTFPRVLSRYVRDEKVLSLETAVHRMTGMTAAKFGLTGRGVLAPGNVADLVVFSPIGIRDQATYDEPRQPPFGIPHVMVAGQWVIRDRKYTGARPGRVLRHTPNRTAG